MHTIDDVHPALRPLVNAFLMKSRYPYTLITFGSTKNVMDTDGQWRMFNMGVNFFDPNYSHSAVGSLKLALKGDNTTTFSVMGRKIVAPRRRNFQDQCSKASSDETKALKLMRQMITPYTLKEISDFYVDRVRETIDPWKRALYSKTRAPFQRVSYETVVAELRNLQSLGINPVTSEFRNMMEETLAYHDEYEYRNSVPVTKTFASIREDGIHTTTNGALDVYPAFDFLPKDTQGKLAMLKMLKDGDSIPEVGIRLDAKNFWIFSMPERVDAGNK
jgi:hypothetical protein